MLGGALNLANPDRDLRANNERVGEPDHGSNRQCLCDSHLVADRTTLGDSDGLCDSDGATDQRSLSHPHRHPACLAA